MAYKPYKWRPAEEALLRQTLPLGPDFAMKVLGKSYMAVYMKAKRLGLKWISRKAIRGTRA